MHRFAVATLTLCAAGAPAVGGLQAQAGGFTVPVEYHRLDNGLRVVLSPDLTAPIVTVGVYYHVGFRNEPRGRTGFAHLFEHMMFQGSENLPKGEFDRLVERNGGLLNGSTRFDYTNYFQVVPAHMLEPVLWAEADRMRGLRITDAELDNQRDVVKNEVLVNVVNQPYGGFPWLDMPQHANENWHNAHNFYGDFQDLEAATLDDVREFFRTYYAPGNAVLVVVGDFVPAEALAMVRRHFGHVPSGPSPAPPDVSEPRQEAEKRFARVDTLAPRPALAFAYHVPERWTPEWFALGLLDQVLAKGNDSRLHRALVQERGLTGNVSGGVNFLLGNMFNYEGPMIWTASLIHDPDADPDSILTVVDGVVEELRTRPLDAETLERARVKFRSSLYETLGGSFGVGRVDLLASLALFDDDPARINRIEAGIAEVTPELVQATAREYLRPTNRTVLTLEPRPATAGGAGEGVER